jgi:putative membrane protein
MRKMAILIAGAALLAGCQTAPPPPPPPPPAPVDLNNPLMAPGFLAQAAAGNEFEIQSSQLALQMSQNPAVRNFANLMISDHARLAQAMAAAATSAGLPPPAPTLLPAQQATLDQLRTTGPNFDAAYRGVQIGGHQQALQLFQNYNAGGDVPAIRAAAGQAIPTIQMHLSQAQMLNVAPPPPPPPPPPPRRAGERG